MDVDTEWRIMGTGSRSLAKEDLTVRMRAFIWIENQLVYARDNTDDPIRVISGGAEGWDEMIALAANTTGIPYNIVLPNYGYGDYYWRRNSVTGEDRSDDFDYLVRNADKVIHTCKDAVYVNGVHANFIRNQWMVNMSDEALVYNPTSRGTVDAVRRLNAASIPWREYGKGS